MRSPGRAGHRCVLLASSLLLLVLLPLGVLPSRVLSPATVVPAAAAVEVRSLGAEAAGREPDGDAPRLTGPRPDHGLITAVTPLPTATGLAVGAGGLLFLALFAAAASRRRSWRFQPPVEVDPATWRDPRLDVARGGLLLVLVAAHVELLVGARGPVAHLMGAVTGPEAFLLVAGLAAGLRQTALGDSAGGLSAASARWRLALAWWAVAVLVALTVLGLRYLPGTADHAVTRWPPVAGGTDLYAGAAPLLEYPPPWWAVRDLFVLHTIPWPLSMLGLLIVLAVATPVLVALLRRRGWWLVIGASWVLYAAGVALGPDWTRGTYETAYPPLVWQVVFVHGLVLAHHRTDLARLLARAATRRLLALLLSVLVAGWATLTIGTALAGGQASDRLLELTQGPDLPAGRLVALAVVGVVTWWLLTACWGPLSRVLDPVLGPLGRAGTTVLVVHVLGLVALGALVDLGRLDLADAGVRTGVTVGLVLLVMASVRSRALRAVVPG